MGDANKTMLPAALQPYKTHLAAGAAGVLLGVVSSKALKMETVNAKSVKSAGLSFAVIAVGSLLGDKFLSSMKV